MARHLTDEQRARARERSRKWGENHRELTRERARVWYAANKERAWATAKRAIAKNPEAPKRRSREWVAANRERRRLVDKEYRIKNQHNRHAYESRDDVRQRRNTLRRERYRSSTEYRAAILSTCRQRKAERKLIRGGMGEVVMKWFDIGGICYICGCQIRYSEITVDHVWPVVRGGEHRASNFMPTHRSCNSRKGHRLNTYLARPELLGVCCG